VIIEKIASALSTGAILRGVRRSGKSTTARAIESARGAVFADAAEWRVAEGFDDEQLDFITGNAEASLAEVAPGGIWVIDNAEVLVSGVAESFVTALAERVIERQVVPVLIRNRYILEEAGALAEREHPLRQVLPVVDLPRPSARDLTRALEKDLWAHPHPEVTAAWVAEWSSCLPGLAYDLLPLGSAPTDERESMVGEFVRQTIEDFELRKPPRPALLSAAATGRLPPMSVLPEHVAMEVGFLWAAGALQTEHEGSAFLRLQGPLWTAVCDSLHGSSAAITSRLQAKDWTEVVLPLSEAIDRANATDILADALEVPCDVDDVAAAIERILDWSRIQPKYALPLSGVLADAMGRAGLRAAFRRLGHEPPGADKYALGEIFVRSFGGRV
jgi:hypothetical protein